MKTILKNLDETVKNTNQTITNARDGKGAINYLSNDEGFVQKIDSTVVRLDSAIYQMHKAGIQLNENLEALKKSWLVRRYFRDKEKEKK